MYGWDGLNSEVELGEWMDEMKWISEGAKARGLDVEKTLDRIYGRPGAPTPVTSDPAADPDADPTPAKKSE